MGTNHCTNKRRVTAAWNKDRKNVGEIRIYKIVQQTNCPLPHKTPTFIDLAIPVGHPSLILGDYNFDTLVKDCLTLSQHALTLAREEKRVLRLDAIMLALG